MDLLENLNDEQKQAVTATSGPVLIIAGAGTGKTRVITNKIAYLVQEKKAKPSEILALTFTDKAAQEMLDRVDEMMPLGYEEIWIKTFHSFCDRILKQEAISIGLDNKYELLSGAENWLFIRKNLFNLGLKYYRPLGNPTRFIEALVKVISRAKDELIKPEDFLKYTESLEKETKKQKLEEGREDEEILAEEFLKTKELAEVYKKYQELLVKENLMDFGDLLFYTHQLFTERKTVLAKYQRQFKYILVDEFQDTNFAQNEIVKLLAQKSRNITVCGDDDQSIYKFRGASISNILQFKNDFPEAKTIVLTKNYRSTQAILDCSYDFVQNNNPERLEVKEKISKKLISAREDIEQIKPELIAAKQEYEEVELVIKKIVELSLHEKRQYRDFAILARGNDNLRSFLESLKIHQIPFQLMGKKGLYSEKIIRELLSYLRFLANPSNNVSFLQVLRMSIWKLPAYIFPIFMQRGKLYSFSLWEIFKKHEEIEGIDHKTKEKIASLLELLQNHQDKTKTHPVSELFHNILIESNLLKELLEDEDKNAEEILNLNLYYQTLRDFEKNSEDKSVYSYIDYIDIMLEAGDDPKTTNLIEDKNAVKLITVHSAKGLEYPVVFLVNLVNQRFPSRNISDSIELPDQMVKEIIPSGDIHLQEERRLFYVGMTRAQDRLFFSYSKYYSGGKKERKPSVFLEEIFGKEFLKTLGEEDAFLLGDKTKQVKNDDLDIDWQKLLPHYFSFTQLETFKQCPLQYKFNFVYRIPVPTTHPLSFGQTIHRTLKDFYEKIIDGQQEISEKKLLDLYGKNWNREGFLSSEHVEEQFLEGQNLLKNFYKKNQFNWGSPLYLEKEFVYKIAPEISIKGYFDRVDLFPDGLVEIIDYKTGQVKDLEQKRKDAKKALQLSIYALAGKEVFGWNLDQTKLSLYYLEPNEKVSLAKNVKDLLGVKEEIIQTVEDIRKSDFEPKKGFHCNFCSYKNICPLW